MIQMTKCVTGADGFSQFAKEAGWKSDQECMNDLGILDVTDQYQGKTVIYPVCGPSIAIDVKNAAELQECILANVVCGELFLDNVVALRFGAVWYVVTSEVLKRS